MVYEELIKKVAANVAEKLSPSIPLTSPHGANDIESTSRQLRELQTAVGELTRKVAELKSQQRHYSLPISENRELMHPVTDQGHPSRELFNVPEEVTEFVDYLETKQCVLDPKLPCVGSGECRARGF